MSVSDKEFKEIKDAAKQAFPNATVTQIKHAGEYAGTYTCIETAWGYTKGDIISNSFYRSLPKQLRGFFLTTSQFIMLSTSKKR